MRNLIIAGAVVAVGAAGYMVSQQGDDGDPGQEPKTAAVKTSVLDYVPADTVFFSGQLEPFPLKGYLQNTTFAQAAVPEELIYELEHERNPQKLFFSSLIQSYFQAATSAESFQKTFGLPDQLEGAVYAVGMLPVVRYKASDSQAIWNLFDKAEQDSGYKHELRTLKGLQYRVYPLTERGGDNQKGPEKLELLVAEQDNWVTITINSHVNTEQDLEVAFALKQPASSLQNTGAVQAIQKKHNYLPHSIAYFDHKALVTAFTTENGNSLATMITKAIQQGNNKQALAEVRNPDCQAEMGEIVASWPRTVMGMREMDISAQRSYMNGSMIVESSNSSVMKALASIQGFIPSYLKEKQIFGYGIGIDANKLNPALSSIWSAVLEPTYKCAPLQKMQQSMQQSNPAALAMFTGMVQGVKGVGMAVQDFSVNLDGPQPQVDSIQGLISLSADNPEVLFNMAKNFAPPLAGIQLPTDGTPVDLSAVMPAPPEVNIKPMLALKGKHLVIYSGEKGEQQANSLAKEQPVSNGLMNLSLDYKEMLSPIIPVLETNAADPEVTKQLQILKDMDMHVTMDIDLSADGIEISSVADMKAPAN